MGCSQSKGAASVAPAPVPSTNAAAKPGSLRAASLNMKTIAVASANDPDTSDAATRDSDAQTVVPPTTDATTGSNRAFPISTLTFGNTMGNAATQGLESSSTGGSSNPPTTSQMHSPNTHGGFTVSTMASPKGPVPFAVGLDTSSMTALTATGAGTDNTVAAAASPSLSSSGRAPTPPQSAKSVVPLPPRVPVITDQPITSMYDLGPKPLGKGAQGVVHIATHKTTGKQYAIKAIERSRMPKGFFENEVEGMRRVKGHGSVVTLHEVWDYGGVVGLVIDPVTNVIALKENAAAAVNGAGRRRSSGGSSVGVATPPTAPSPAELTEADAASPTASGGPTVPDSVKRCVFLVLEYMGGGELFECLIEKGAYGEEDARIAMRCAVDALAEMHMRGLFHRDLKPENLLLSSKLSPSSVKIADFGLCWVAPHSTVPALEYQVQASSAASSGSSSTYFAVAATTTSAASPVPGGDASPAPAPAPSSAPPFSIVSLEEQAALWPSSFPVPKMSSTSSAGTWAYSSPEKVRNKGKGGYNEKVDVWALGVILYVILSAYHPFDVDGICSAEEIKENILIGAYSFSDDAWGNVSSQAKDLITKMIVSDPSKRLSAAEVLKHPWLAVDATSASGSGSERKVLQPTIGESLARYQQAMAAKMKAGMLATFASVSLMRGATQKRLSASAAQLALSVAGAAAATVAGGSESSGMSSPQSSLSPDSSRVLPFASSPSRMSGSPRRPSTLATVPEDSSSSPSQPQPSGPSADATGIKDEEHGSGAGSGSGSPPRVVAVPIDMDASSPATDGAFHNHHGSSSAATTPLSLVTTPPHKRMEAEEGGAGEGDAASAGGGEGMLSPNRMKDVEEDASQHHPQQGHLLAHLANPLASPAVGADKLLGARAKPSGGIVGGDDTSSATAAAPGAASADADAAASAQANAFSAADNMDLEASQGSAISAISAATAATAATFASSSAGLPSLSATAVAVGTASSAGNAAAASGANASGSGVGIAMRAPSAHRSSANHPANAATAGANATRTASGRLLVVPDSPSHQSHPNPPADDGLLLLSPMSVLGSPLPSVTQAGNKTAAPAAAGVAAGSRPSSGRGAPRYPPAGAPASVSTPRPGSSGGGFAGGNAPAATGQLPSSSSAALGGPVSTLELSTPAVAEPPDNAASSASSSASSASSSGAGRPGSAEGAASAVPPFPSLE